MFVSINIINLKDWFLDWINVAVYILVVVLVAAQLKIIRMSQLCAPTVLWFSDLITLFAKPVSIFFGLQI